MPKTIEMPKLADTMTEGKIVRWLIKEGDKVSAGQEIAEIETDKATMSYESLETGTVQTLLVEPGVKVPCGTPIAMLLGRNEKPGAADDGSSSKATPQKSPSTSPKSSPESKPAGQPAPTLKSTATLTSGPSSRIKASPLAKKIAASRKIDLATLKGSGPGGRIVAKDVESAGPQQPASTQSGTAPKPISPIPAGEGDQRIPLSGMRSVIAERLLLSKTTIPHFYLTIEVDASMLMNFRGAANAATEATGGPKMTINDFVLKAVVAAAQKVPQVNASFAGDAIIQYGSVNLAVAVAVDDGLVTPVIRDAQKKSLREISEIVKDLASRARNKKLKPDEYTGGTITVSNLGAYGIEDFCAIINPPQSLILAVGAIVKKPVVGPNDTLTIGQRMKITLSGDHRVVDGAVGATYLAELKKFIENPALMLL